MCVVHILNVYHAHIVKLNNGHVALTLKPMTNHTSNLLGVVGLAVAELIQSSSREILKHAGETPAALVVIGYDLGPSNDLLRRVLGLSHSGTVRLVDRLVDDGLVERRDGSDGRSVALYVTKRGRGLREKILAGRLAAIRPLLAGLSDAEQKTLTSLLHKMLASLETTDMERRTLCRLCDNRVCSDCPIPADF